MTRLDIGWCGDMHWYNALSQPHNNNGPAVQFQVCKEWWVNGLRHRLDGPAVETNDGDKEWWVNSKLHRLDGPALEYVNNEYKGWYIKNFLFRSEFEYWLAVQKYDNT